MQARKIIEASITPPNERFLFVQRRCQAHKPEAGRNARREVLVRAAKPQSTPNSIHGKGPSRSSKVRASQKIKVNRNAARLVSHTQRVHQYMTKGSSAQSQAVHTATFLLKHRRA